MSLYAERTVVENRRKGDVGERAGDDGRLKSSRS